MKAFPANQIAEALLETLRSSQQSTKQTEINNNTAEKKESKKEEQLCEQHGEPLKLYCDALSCEGPRFLCALCMPGRKHHGHYVRSLESTAKIKSYRIESNKRDFDKISNAWREHLRKLQIDVINERSRETNRTLGIIEDRKKEIIAEVEKMAGCLREKVLHMNQEAINDIHAECEIIKKYAEKSETYANECQRLLDSGDPVLIMDNYSKYSPILNDLVETEDYNVAKNASCPIFAKSDFQFTFRTDTSKVLGSVTMGSKPLPKAGLPKYVVYGQPKYTHEKTFYTEEWNKSSNRKMCVVDDNIILCGRTNDGYSTLTAYQYQGEFKGKAAWKLKIQDIVSDISEVVLQSESYLAVSLPEEHAISFYKLNNTAMEVADKLLPLGDHTNENIVPGKVASYNSNNIVVVNTKPKLIEIVVLEDMDLTMKKARRIRSLSTGLTHVTGLCCKRINQRPAVLLSAASEIMAIGIDLENASNVWEHKESFGSLYVDERGFIHCHILENDVRIFNPDGTRRTFRSSYSAIGHGKLKTVQICILQGTKLVVHSEESETDASIHIFDISYTHS